MANRSFIENINSLANAAALAGGDVVEDTTLARNEAVIAKNAAKVSETNAKTSELLAESWANKGHNNPVTGTVGVDAEYSAYHWKTEAEILIGDPVVDDNVTSGTKAFSSQKTTDLLATKSETTHNHDNRYEPKFLKNTAFNKNFGNTVNDVATGYHVHDGNNGSIAYEPEIGAKKTGFNKDFGTVAGTVAEGNHTHAYEPSFSKKTAFNKNFVVDTNNPTADEIPRGTHNHKAVGITFDNTNAATITSTTVQGALTQLDSAVSVINIEEKCKLVAGMTDASYVVDIISANTPVVLNAGMTIANSKNALYSNGIVVNYAAAPANFVEGNYSATVTINALASKSYYIIPTVNGVAIDAKFKAEFGDATVATNTIAPITISGWISGLQNGDILGVAIANATDATDVTVHHATVSFAGQPEGALIANGQSVTHADIIARDAADQHPISSITGLQTALDGKTATGHTHLIADITDFDPATKADKVVPTQAGNVATLDAAGNITDSTVSLATKANVGGNATQTFLVGDATLAGEAVNKSQLDAISTLYTSQTNFDAHEAAANPHGTTAADIGAAATVHSHTIADVTNLQTTLDGKYNKVATPVTGNLPRFAAGNVLEDSGLKVETSVPAGALFTDTDNLVDLTDTNLVSPINGQVISYDSGTGKWVNITPVTGVTDHLLLSNIGTKTHAQLDAIVAPYERIDKIIQTQDVLSMSYTGGNSGDKLSNVTYTNSYSEDLVYNVGDKLEFIDHKFNNTVQGYTTLSYTNDKLTSSTYTAGAR